MECDVLIIGARVAGASLAILLGERGHRVVLVDRDQFPSDTLSTHFVPGFGVAQLQRLGVRADIEAAGFRRIVRTRTWIEDCLLEGPSGPPGAYALAPRRDVLDAVLIDHARRRGGAEVMERTTAESLIEADGRVVGAVLRSSSGDRSEVRARVVVGADGKFSKVAEWVKAEAYDTTPPMRPLYYGYFHGVRPLPEPAVELLFANNQIGFLFPMRPDEDCLALEVQPEQFAEFRADPQAAFEAAYRALPGMAERMVGARLEGKLQGTRGVDNYLRKPYGPGWALTGDAGYLKDPSTGRGITDALEQALMLADALHAALRGAEWEASMSAFHRLRDASVLPTYRWTIGATQLQDTSPQRLLWLRAAFANPHLARQVFDWLPTALADGLPPHLHPVMHDIAQAFGAPPLVPAGHASMPTEE